MTKSIVGKLTWFVGVLVALNTGSLIGAAYFITSAMLRDQIHDRLTTIAADRQGILLSALKSQDQFLAGFILMFVAVLTVVGMLISDLLLAWIDPRIRMGGGR